MKLHIQAVQQIPRKTTPKQILVRLPKPKIFKQPEAEWGTTHN